MSFGHMTGGQQGESDVEQYVTTKYTSTKVRGKMEKMRG